MKRGWSTSEHLLAIAAGFAILKLLDDPIISLGDGIATGCACHAVAWIAGKYAQVRTEAKRGP